MRLNSPPVLKEVFFMSKNVKILVYCAMCIALAAVTDMIKVFRFPTGGSITLASTLFATLPAWFFGPVAGIFSGIAYGILQFVLNPYVLTPVQVILDYGLAFAAYGLAGFFYTRKNGLQIGYIVGSAFRWFFAFLSGWIFFGEYAWAGWNAAAYSAVYNLIYIGANTAIVLILISIPQMYRALEAVKKNAVS